jgi:hypothetical protein
MQDLNNKVILVSKRILDKENNESFDTYFGKVISYNEDAVKVLKPNQKEESLPYDDDLYEVAEEGFYELADGSTYENPDYIAEFLIHVSEEAWREYHKNEK